MEPKQTLAELAAELDAQRTKYREAEARLITEVERLAAVLPAQVAAVELVAEKEREIAGLWGRIHEMEGHSGRLSASEAHWRATAAAKDEEIASLIARLKDYERLQARVRELEPDDLKRIYGIGPVLEGKLQALGIRSFEQIGRWGDAEIEKYQEQLPEAKIRRDAWVKGAREEYFRKYRKTLV